MDRFAKLFDSCELFLKLSALRADFTQGRPRHSLYPIPTGAYVPDTGTVERMKQRMLSRTPSNLSPAVIDPKLISLILGREDLIISGSEGAVSPAGAKIRIQNLTKAIGIHSIAAPNGSFKANIPGEPEDEIRIQAITDAGSSEPYTVRPETKRNKKLRRVLEERDPSWGKFHAPISANIEDVLTALAPAKPGRWPQEGRRIVHPSLPADKPSKKPKAKGTKLPVLEMESEEDVYRPQIGGISIEDAVESFLEDARDENSTSFSISDAVDIANNVRGTSPAKVVKMLQERGLTLGKSASINSGRNRYDALIRLAMVTPNENFSITSF